jgi:Fe2+ or Zn2+ uptake regulation protein
VPELKCLFSTHGLRCTQQRRAIYEALVSTDSHPTAEELHQMIDGGGGLSLATVYNTLEAFCQAGLCQKLAAANGSCRYDGDISDHLHVKDAQTGRIRDVPEDLGPAPPQRHSARGDGGDRAGDGHAGQSRAR